MDSKQILLLDGGFSNELSKRCSYDVNREPLWTAKALQTDQSAITETHLQYLKGSPFLLKLFENQAFCAKYVTLFNISAGADIIETATYQATVQGLHEALALQKSECEELIKNSVKLAQNAVTQYKSLNDADGPKQTTHPFIAGSVGPYGVYLHDGSEYSGSYMNKVSPEEIIELHSKRLEILGSSPVDLLALETMPSLAEVEILLQFLEKKNINKKVWVSFMLKVSYLCFNLHELCTSTLR